MNNLAFRIVKNRWRYLLFEKLPIQSHAIAILFIAEIQHQDKGTVRKHPGWEEKSCTRVEINTDDQGKHDQVGQQDQPAQHEQYQHSDMVEISSKYGPIDHLIKIDRIPAREYNNS